MVDLEKREGHSDKAYELMRLAVQWKDSVLVEKNIETINELTTRYETKKKDAEINLLTQEKKFRESERLWLISIVTVAVAFSLVVVYFFMQKRSANVLLEKALKANQMLVREIHHRVKNNLQIISSLLNIQSTFLEGDEAKKAVADIQDRVISMSVVHQNLYTDAHVVQVRADVYFDKLIRAIRRTFDDPEDPVQMSYDIDPLEVPSEEAMNIGLIINEAITNALKHAFPAGFEKEKKIRLICKSEGEMLVLTIRDNGVGFHESEKMKRRYGWHMIHSLIKSMKGHISISGEDGTSISIQIPLRATYV